MVDLNKRTNTLRQHLVHPKDATEKEKKEGVICEVKCKTCSRLHIGEMARTLDIKTTASAMNELCLETEHEMDWANVKIVWKEDHCIDEAYDQRGH